MRSIKLLWFFMKNRIGRLFVALIPFIGALFIWGAWQVKVSPWLDRFYETESVIIEFHKEMDRKIASGELTKDEAIFIYKRNAINGQHADEQLVELFKVVLLYLFLGLTLCIFAASIRIIVLEVKGGWEL